MVMVIQYVQLVLYYSKFRTETLFTILHFYSVCLLVILQMSHQKSQQKILQ